MRIIQNSDIPIYQQIADSFRRDILEGRISEGDYLPSIRALARELKISVITTMKAYETLSEEGLITAAPGKGYYVNAQDREMLREQHLRRVESALQEAIEAARIAGMGDDELRQTLMTLLSIE